MLLKTLPLARSAGRRRSPTVNALPWPSAAPIDPLILSPTHTPSANEIREVREYWGFTQDEAGYKAHVSGSAWQKYERGTITIPGAVWAQFKQLAPVRDATHFQFTVHHLESLITVALGDFVQLRPRRGPLVVVKLVSTSPNPDDLLQAGLPTGRLKGFVVGFPEFNPEQGLPAYPFRVGEPVRFAAANIVHGAPFPDPSWVWPSAGPETWLRHRMDAVVQGLQSDGLSASWGAGAAALSGEYSLRVADPRRA